MPAAPFLRKVTVALPIVLALLALALRLYGLADKPLWLDEIITFKRAGLPLAELVNDALINRHYPTYFLIIATIVPVDMSEWALRFPSAVIGALCVLLVTLIATELRGPRAGLVAGLLMALSPFEVQFSQEARSYALISCLVLVAVWGMVRIARRPLAAALSISHREALRGAWASYTLGTLGALLVQNSAAPWLLVSNLAMLVIIGNATSGRSALLRNWIGAQAMILFIWLPALLTMSLTNKGDLLGGIRWVPTTTWETIWSIVAGVYLFRISDLTSFALLPALLPGFGVVVVVLALLGIWRLKGEPASLAVIGLAFLAMPVAVAVISMFQSMWVPRYLMWSTGPYFVLAGIGAAALSTRVFPLVAAAVAVGGIVSLLPYYGSETKPRWDRAAAHLIANARAGDIVVAQNEGVRFALSAYAQHHQLDPNIPILSWDAPQTARRAAEAPRVWAAYGRAGQGRQEPEQIFRKRLLPLGAAKDEVRISAQILIFRFDKTAMRPGVP